MQSIRGRGLGSKNVRNKGRERRLMLEPLEQKRLLATIGPEFGAREALYAEFGAAKGGAVTSEVLKKSPVESTTGKTGGDAVPPVGPGRTTRCGDHGCDSGSATAVGVPSTTAGDLEVAGDVDFFSFSAVAGTIYDIEVLLSGTLTDSTLSLFAPDGTTLVDFDDDGGDGFGSKITFETLIGGTYFVGVDSFLGLGAGTYDLDLSSPGTFAITPIGIPSTSPCEIDPAGDSDWYSFPGTSGTAYEVEVILDTLTDSFLEVFGPGGNSIGFNDDIDFFGGNLASKLEINALASGTYFVKVSGFGAETGTCDLAIDDIGTFPITPVTSAATPGNLKKAGDTQFFSFPGGGGGGTYTIEAALNGKLEDSVMTLYDDAGIPVDFSDDVAGPYNLGSRIVFSGVGTYYAEVGSFAGASKGTFTFLYNVGETLKDPGCSYSDLHGNGAFNPGFDSCVDVTDGEEKVKKGGLVIPGSEPAIISLDDINFESELNLIIDTDTSAADDSKFKSKKASVVWEDPTIDSGDDLEVTAKKHIWAMDDELFTAGDKCKFKAGDGIYMGDFFSPVPGTTIICGSSVDMNADFSFMVGTHVEATDPAKGKIKSKTKFGTDAAAIMWTAPKEVSLDGGKGPVFLDFSAIICACGFNGKAKVKGFDLFGGVGTYILAGNQVDLNVKNFAGLAGSILGICDGGNPKGKTKVKADEMDLTDVDIYVPLLTGGKADLKGDQVGGAPDIIDGTLPCPF